MYENEVIPPLGTPEPEPAAEEVKPADAEPSETTDQETGAEPAEEEAEPTGDTPAAPKKENKVQKRIDELTAKIYEAQRQAEYYKGLAEGRGKPQEEQQPQPETVIPGLRPKPTVDQFEDYEQFIEAVADWVDDKKTLEREYKKQQTQAVERQKTTLEKHQERANAFATVHADYDEAIDAVEDIIFPNSTIDSIFDSEHSAELTYFLGKNRTEAERIAKLPPVKQLIEIGKIEARFEKKEDPPPPKRVTQAPAPITPVNAKQSLAPDPANMSDDDWHKWENERCRKQGRLY